MNDNTDSIIQAESGGDPNAKNPNSSASGPGQFIDSTFLSVLKAHHPDIAQGQSDDALLAMKNDPALGRQLTADYASDNGKALSAAGLPVTPGTTYLAHFAGPAGATKVLQADPNAPIESILGDAAVKANPFLKGMTAQGVQAWAAKRMGVTSPTAAPAGAPGTPSAAPAPPAPNAAPIFAGTPPSAAPVATYQDPAPPPMQPLFAAQPKPPIDVSRLRAALAARSPIFANGGAGRG